MRHFYKKFYLRETHPFQSQLVRPFLKFSRFEFLKLCEFWHLPIYPDSSNFCLSLKRNRLRLFFLPYLKIFFNKNMFQKIDQIQKILDFENSYFEHFLQKYDDPLLLINFRYFPKTFKYRFIYRFFFFMKKKISFFEISCLFNKLFLMKKK